MRMHDDAQPQEATTLDPRFTHHEANRQALELDVWHLVPGREESVGGQQQAASAFVACQRHSGEGRGREGAGLAAGGTGARLAVLT